MNRALTISDEDGGALSQVSTESSMHATDMFGRPQYSMNSNETILLLIFNQIMSNP